MTAAVAHQIEALALLCVPRGSSAEWEPASARVGLQLLRRLQGELDALRAVLVGVLKTETGRDTKATLVRGFGMSSAEAAKAEQVADIVGRVPGAGEALANGSVTGEHLRRLMPITEPTEADELLALAESQSPDEFAKTSISTGSIATRKAGATVSVELGPSGSSRPTTAASACASSCPPSKASRFAVPRIRHATQRGEPPIRNGPQPSADTTTNHASAGSLMHSSTW